MNFRLRHTNLNVQDLDRAVTFYKEALGMQVKRVNEKEDFTLTFMTDEAGLYDIELTWLKDHADRPYELGENETHICFSVDDYEAAHKLHKEMGVICYENEKMGLYFIEDPDGYWIEIIPENR